MSDPTPSRGKVLVLNYHEVTQDPRVMKQSRGLSMAGYDVMVACRQLKDAPKTATVDGVRIHRFDCFPFADGRQNDLDLYTFFDTARPLIEQYYLPYAQAAEKLHWMKQAEAWAREEGRIKGQKNRRIRAVRRELGALKRRVQKLPAALQLGVAKLTNADAAASDTARAAYWEAPHDSSPLALRSLSRMLHRRARAQSGVTRDAWRSLYQSISVLFGAALMKEKLDFVPDVIHAHDFYTLPGAILLAQRTGARVLYDAHEYEPGRASKMPPDGNALIDAMERDCLALTDRMTTVGPSIADLYATRFPGPPPGLILNAPDIDPDAVASGTSRGRLRAMAGLDAQDRVLVFTGGTQRENRGLHIVCRALALLPGYHLVCLGARNPGDDAWLMGHARDAGVADRIHLLDGVPASEVVEVISDADIAICLIQDAGISYRFAMPNKLFEATFANLPLVVSDLPDMRRHVQDHGTGVAADQTDPHAIADAIRTVGDTLETYTLSPDAHATLCKDLSWDVQVKKLTDIVQDLAGSERRW